MNINVTTQIEAVCYGSCLRQTSKMKSIVIKSSLRILSALVLLSYFYQPAVATLEMKQPNEPLTLLWGIADTTAYVGQLFNYTIPNDAFQGNIIHYNITEVGKGTLPAWLIFNALKAELKGIPGPEDKGQIYLEVKATGDENSKISDVFSIEVIDGTNDPYTLEQISEEKYKNGSPKMVRCKREEPQTLVTVIVDCDLDLMKPGDKVNLIETMVSHLNLAPEMLKLMPVGNKPMIDGSALVVGPGNIKVPNFVGAFVSWLAGCGQVTNDHMAILQQVESSAASGDMSSALGHNIVRWHVTNTRFQPKFRKRRNATPTPTLMPPAPTTVIPVASTISSSSAFIQPSKPVEMQTTKLVETATKVTVPSSVVSTGKATDVIKPSETVRMTKTMIAEATEILPTKVIPMKSDVMTTSSVTPSTTIATSTQSSTIASTNKPPVPTSASTTMAPITTQAPTAKPPITKTTAQVIHHDPCLDKSRLTKPVLTITINVGEIKRHKITEDIFADCYDINTSDMTIEITHGNGTDLQSNFWLQLTKATYYYINANPLKADVGNHTFIVNRHFNDHKKATLGAIAVHVVKLGDVSNPPNHELSMKIETDYDEFMSELKKRLELANKISHIFGDKNIKALSVTRLERGSVIYAWTNNSLSRNICPVDDITEIVDKMLKENGDLTPDAIRIMQPYTVKQATSVPLGSCIGHPDFPTRSTKKVPTTAKPTAAKPTTAKPTTAKPTTERPTTSTAKPTTAKPVTAKPMTAAPTTKYVDSDTPSKSSTTFKSMEMDTNAAVESTEITTKTQVAAAGTDVGGGSDMWITTVVPAIVVVCVLVIAIIIACCLYRKKRKGKMKLEEKNNLPNNKGVPVILADEYEEKTNDSTKPLIMEDEKPPMPPPDYRASSETSNNSNSTHPAYDCNIEEIEMEEAESSPLYSPPPPVTASNNSKPPHVQSSRGPPPYVPP